MFKPRRHSGREQVRPVNIPTAPQKQANVSVPQKGWFENKQAYQQKVDDRAARQIEIDAQYSQDQSRYERELGVAQSMQRRQDVLNQNDANYVRRQQMMRGLPPEVRQQEAAQILGDRIVDASNVAQAGVGGAKQFARNAAAIPGNNPLTTIGIGSAVGSAALLNAYSQLQNDEMDRGPISTTARATSNALSGIGGPFVGGMGQDPLAMARNGVRDAEEYLGSERMLEAMVLDQIEPMEDGMSQEEIEFEALVDAKAQELLQVQSRNSAGDPVFMSPGAAYTSALDIIKKQYGY